MEILIISAPFVLPLLIMLLVLLYLRRVQHKKASRMMQAENYATGATTTSWEALHGPTTLSDLPVPQSFENEPSSNPNAVRVVPLSPAQSQLKERQLNQELLSTKSSAPEDIPAGYRRVSSSTGSAHSNE